MEEPDQIRNCAAEFFQNLLSKEPVDDTAREVAETHFLTYVPCLVSSDDNHNLFQPVTMPELKSAVLQLDPESASGSEGYSGCFYQKCWEIISMDLYPAVQEFFLGFQFQDLLSLL